MPKSQKELNTNLMIAIYQNLQTAMQSINNVLEKVKDSKLKKELKTEFKQYDEFIEKCEDLAKEQDIELKDNGFFKKAKMWLSVNMATMLDKSNRKIASINIVGSTMGVIDLMSVLSDCKRCKKELLSFGKEVLEMEERNIEKLKPYILVENNKPNSEITDQAKETGALSEYERNESPTYVDNNILEQKSSNQTPTKSKVESQKRPTSRGGGKGETQKSVKSGGKGKAQKSTQNSSKAADKQ